MDSKPSIDITKHAVTYLSLDAQHLHSTKENLFDSIQHYKRRYIVDTHIDWFSMSGIPENQRIAFILGTTLDKEISRLHHLIETSDGKLSAVTQSVPPRVEKSGFKMYHLRRGDSG